MPSTTTLIEYGTLQETQFPLSMQSNTLFTFVRKGQMPKDTNVSFRTLTL